MPRAIPPRRTRWRPAPRRSGPSGPRRNLRRATHCCCGHGLRAAASGQFQRFSPAGAGSGRPGRLLCYHGGSSALAWARGRSRIAGWLRAMSLFETTGRRPFSSPAGADVGGAFSTWLMPNANDGNGHKYNHLANYAYKTARRTKLGPSAPPLGIGGQTHFAKFGIFADLWCRPLPRAWLPARAGMNRTSSPGCHA